MNITRRNFVEASLVAALPFKESLKQLPVAANSYNWITFFARQDMDWGGNLAENFKDFVKTGIKAYEPGLADLADAQRHLDITQKFQIAMPSVYVNSLLHTEAGAEASIAEVTQIADLLAPKGCKIMVTNPTPLAWGGKEAKTDAQNKLQAKNLELLGSELRKRGIKLAYHTHNTEMLAGAREFHHMLQNTSAENVGFCLDAHWIFRGSENSELAVYDVIKMYGKRIIELHLRQSKNGVWSETFEAKADIDYHKVHLMLSQMGVNPHLVIEQCVEEHSPNTMGPIEAHIEDLKNVKSVFGRS